MNKLSIVGHLTTDATLVKRNVAGVPTDVCTFTVAANSGRRDENGQRPVMYVRVTMWRNQAVNTAPYLKKGTQVLVEGPLKVSVYQSRQDGSWRAQPEISVVQNFEFLSAQKRDGDEAPADAPAAAHTSADGDPDADEYPFG